MSAVSSQAAVFTDFAGLSDLKHRARNDASGSLREVAQQFEAIFMQMVLKSMRDATPGGGLFESQQSGFYSDLFDQQIALTTAGRGGLGLADAIVRQLSESVPGGGRDPLQARAGLEHYRARALSGTDDAPSPIASASPGPVSEEPKGSLFESPGAFVRGIWRHAHAAARRLGLAPEALVAQAALETGWGQHVMQRPDGQSSHNLFGIKADGRWSGDKVAAPTLEFREGALRRERAEFRAYRDIGQGFADYAAFLEGHPRYGRALQAGDDPVAFARELSRAGYATDPAYPQKIKNILQGNVLQRALAGLNK